MFSSGNGRGTAPSIEAGLPLRFPELEPGWLAVTAINGAGQLAEYANACGPTSRWCVAAPGDARTIASGGGEIQVQGTSAATAFASGALAALYSAFPTISPQQTRQRLLDTANADTDPSGNMLGQGVIDLEAALSPAGELMIAGRPLDTVTIQPSGLMTSDLWDQVSVTALDNLGYPFDVSLAVAKLPMHSPDPGPSGN